MTRRLAFVVAALLVLASPGIQRAAAQTTNDATAVNKKDGKSVFKLAFQVKQVNDSDVDAENSATAFASCTDCRTVAGAIQVVFATDPDSLDAENSSVAINYDCTECETLAAAYQFVIAGGDELELSHDGKRRLWELRKEFKDLKKRDDLTTQEIANEMARIAGEVGKVIDDEMVAADGADDTAETTTTTPDSSTSTTPGDAPTSTSTSPPAAQPTSTVPASSTTSAP